MISFADITIIQIGLWLLSVIIPILVFYVIYLILTKAFNYLGFSNFESVIIVLISFLFSFPIILFGFNLSNITLFSYNGWKIAISTTGAIIPILISCYLIIKRKLSIKTVIIGIFIVSIISFLVTTPEPTRGIVARFPYWLLPAFTASLCAILLLKKDFKKGASLSYIISTFGILIGADFLHIPQLLQNPPTTLGTRATIGGAVIFDLIFITGILAVILYGIIMFRYRLK
jgi:hypothetical protein